MRTVKFAVIQDGFAVFGAGSTRATAISDAKKWIDNPDELDEILDNNEYSHNYGEMFVAENVTYDEHSPENYKIN